MQARVYALFDPREPNRIRYIGQTRHTIERRRDAHVYRATHKKLNLKCDSWIRKLVLEAGLTPGVRLLVSGDWTNDELDNFEITYISRYKMLGHPLTNMTPGGRGLSGYTQSVEHRAKISAAHKGKIVSAETSRRISQAKTGVKYGPQSPERRAATGKLHKGKTVSAATRAKISKANRERRFQCNECDMITGTLGMYAHQKSTNHKGTTRQ